MAQLELEVGVAVLLIRIKKTFERVVTSAHLVEAICEIISEEHRFDQQKEHFFAIGLNSDNEIKYVDLVSLGSLTCFVSHPREVFRHAIAEAVNSIIICHNHPSGDCQPSERDIKLTERMVAAGQILGIEVLDHIVVENDTGNYFSIRDQLPESGVRWKAARFEP